MTADQHDADWWAERPNQSHGTASTYRNGCRCSPCRTATAERMRDENARRRERLATTDVPHGRKSTYDNWGCRCSACRMSVRAYRDSKTR